MRYPLGQELVQVLQKYMKEAPERSARARIVQEHRAWLATREERCTIPTPGISLPDQDIYECLRQLDGQRTQELSMMRAAQLIRAGGIDHPPADLAGFAIALHGRVVSKIAVTQGDTLAAVVRFGFKENAVDILELGTSRVLHTIPGEFGAPQAEFSANGRLLFLAATPLQATRRVQLIDVETGDILARLENINGAIRPVDGGRKLIYSSDKELLIYDLAAAEAVSAGAMTVVSVRCLVATPKEDILAAAGDRQVSAWEIRREGEKTTLRKKAEFELPEPDGPAAACGFSQDGRLLMIMTTKGTLNVYSVSNLKKVNSAAFPSFSVHGDVMQPLAGNLHAISYTEGGAARTLFFEPDRFTGVLEPLATGVSAPASRGQRLLVAGGDVLKSIGLPSTGTLAPLANLSADLAGKLAEKKTGAKAAAIQPLAGLPTEMQIEAIGVQSAAAPPGTKPWWADPELKAQWPSSPAYSIKVMVGATDKPVVLVLAARKKVSWVLAGDAPSHILLAGDPGSTVANAHGAATTYIGPAVSSGPGGSQYAELNEAVRAYTGHGIDRFQGADAGSAFSVGKSLSATTEIIRRVGADGVIEFTDKPK